MAYKKPTLIELLTEFVFVPGAFPADRALASAERLRASGMGVVEFATGLTGATDGSLEAAQRIRCWSDDKRRLAQFGNDRVIANQVAPYGGWNEYTKHARAVLDAAGYPELRLASVSHHAIDRFEVAADGFTLGQYLVCDGQRIPKWYEACSEPCDITLGRGLIATDGSNRQLKIQVKTQGSDRVVRIDSVFHDALSGRDALNVLDVLHEEATGLFEELVTSVTREKVMEGRIS